MQATQATMNRKESLDHAITFGTLHDAAEYCECVAVFYGYVASFGQFSWQHWLSVAKHCTRYVDGVLTFCASCDELRYWAIRA